MKWPMKRETERLKGNVLLNDLIDDINEVMRDIDLHYRRVNYLNPVVNHMLKMMYEILGVLKKYISFEDLDLQEKPKQGLFNISSKDLDG